MATQEAIHKRNLESSILFMQQEHAATLKALHDEIQKLQKKCTDLTFELNMAGLDVGGRDTADTQEHIKHLTSMIDTQRETQHELEVELDKKDKLIKENEYTYKRQKMKHIEELKAKNKEMNQLQAELEAASNTNAYLQNELLKFKKEKYLANQAQAVAAGQKGPEPHAPAPPKESRVNPKRAFHIRRTMGEPVVNVSDDGRELRPVRPSSGGRGRARSGSTSRSDSPSDLARPFLRHDDEKVSGKVQPPLPPIRTSSGRVMFQDQVDVVHLSVHSVPKVLSKSKKAAPVTTAVETLAIDQVSHSNPAWRHGRTKESHSSEYR